MLLCIVIQLFAIREFADHLKIFFLCSLLVFGIQMIHAQTWSENVASIIYNNCSSCHHAGGIGPFALMGYQDAVDNAANIKSYVQAKMMPPWMPDPNYSHFKGERFLS